MKCNIDRKGRIARMITGVLTLVLAAGLFIAGGQGRASGPWIWIGAGSATAYGLFQIWEGWCGWCIVRAMGFKTPM